jgi:carbamoyl-phosphate synthase large subunit
MITVMVTGVGSNIGQGIVKALRMSGINVRIIGTDMNPLSAGLFRCDKGYVLPQAESKDFKTTVLRVCKDEKTDIILIGSDPEVPVFSSEKKNIEHETGAFVLVSSEKIVDTFHDKWNTFLFLKENGFNYPESVLEDDTSIKKLIKRVGFPLIVKPRIGGGSKNLFTVSDRKELQCALKIVLNPIIQEHIATDEEYTTGIFFDSKSDIKGIITMKRELIAGTTYRAIVHDFPLVRKEMERIAERLGREGAIGPINVQCRLSKRRPITFEINPRFSGTTAFRAKFNFNEPAAAIRHFITGEELGRFEHSKGIVMRYWEEVYVSLEDGEEIMKKGVIEKPISEILRVF